MSEPTVATPATPPKGKAKKKIFGLPMPVAIGAAAALAALGYIWWRDRHKSAASASTSTSSAAEIGALEAELAELQAEASSSAFTGVGTGGGGGSGGGGVGSSSTGTTTPMSTSTSTGTGTTKTKVAKNPVKNLHITDAGYTSLTGSWDKSDGATSYLITVLHGGTVLKTQHSVGTTARVGNLKRKTAYEYRVRAQPGGVGGSDAHVDVTTK